MAPSFLGLCVKECHNAATGPGDHPLIGPCVCRHSCVEFWTMWEAAILINSEERALVMGFSISFFFISLSLFCAPSFSLCLSLPLSIKRLSVVACASWFNYSVRSARGSVREQAGLLEGCVTEQAEQDHISSIDDNVNYS